MYSAVLLSLAALSAPIEAPLADAQRVTVETADGSTVGGAVVSLDVSLKGARLVVNADNDKKLAFTRAQLRRITSVDQKTSPPKNAAAWIDLVDGSRIVASKYTVTAGKATITLPAGESAQLSTRAIDAVRFVAPSKEFNKQWQELIEDETEGDLLVISKDGSIDRLEGVLHDVTDQRVHFVLEERTFKVRRTKVAGLVYHHSAAAKLPETICRISLADGSKLAAKSIVLKEGKLNVDGTSGLTLNIPWSQIRRIDFTESNVVYLSDLDPQSSRWTPFIGGAKIFATLAKTASPRKDAAIEGGPLRLGGKTYSKGLAVRSRTRLVYRLPNGFTRLKATAGIDDAVRPGGNVELTLLADGKEILKTTITGEDHPLSISLDVRGVVRLTILVDFGKDQDVADHLDLAEARLTK
ncbi:MAG: NPCBM/NEW2 domain-containing protein [Planctomycetes bacterium]|nr:NPCBM/NEW2 domain-containing protein [Planctomycetota bacterium]